MFLPLAERKLNDRDRERLYLARLRGRSYGEIARDYEISTARVRRACAVAAGRPATPAMLRQRIDGAMALLEDLRRAAAKAEAAASPEERDQVRGTGDALGEVLAAFRMAFPDRA